MTVHFFIVHLLNLNTSRLLFGMFYEAQMWQYTFHLAQHIFTFSPCLRHFLRLRDANKSTIKSKKSQLVLTQNQEL